MFLHRLADLWCHLDAHWILKGVHKSHFLTYMWTKWKKMGSESVSWKNNNFNGFPMPKWDAWNGESNVFTLCLLQFKRFEWLQNLMKHGCPHGSKKSSKSTHLVSWSSFLRFCQVLKVCIFWWDLAPQKVGPKSQLSATLAASGCRDGTFGRSAGEVVCRDGERGGVKLSEFEDFAGEHSV